MEREGINVDVKVKADMERFGKNGTSLVLTAVDGELKILMGVRDQIRPSVKENLQRLKKLGVRNLIMLSGDNQGTVDLVARELGLTEAHGNMLPEDKSAYIRRLTEEEGRITAFVGDGVNDSPSLALANIGIAMGGGTDVAIETSDVVLMNSGLRPSAPCTWPGQGHSQEYETEYIDCCRCRAVPACQRLFQRMDEHVHRHAGTRGEYPCGHPERHETVAL